MLLQRVADVINAKSRRTGANIWEMKDGKGFFGNHSLILKHTHMRKNYKLFG